MYILFIKPSLTAMSLLLRFLTRWSFAPSLLRRCTEIRTACRAVAVDKVIKKVQLHAVAVAPLHSKGTASRRRCCAVAPKKTLGHVVLYLPLPLCRCCYGF